MFPCLQRGIMTVGENWTSIQRACNVQRADFFLQWVSLKYMWLTLITYRSYFNPGFLFLNNCKCAVKCAFNMLPIINSYNLILLLDYLPSILIWRNTSPTLPIWTCPAMVRQVENLRKGNLLSHHECQERRCLRCNIGQTC